MIRSNKNIYQYRIIKLYMDVGGHKDASTVAYSNEI